VLEYATPPPFAKRGSETEVKMNLMERSSAVIDVHVLIIDFE
jgi:hypothetical protein